MLDRQNLLSLMKAAAKADSSAPTAYSFNGQSLSYEALNDTLRNELNELAGTYALYRENKNLIFSLIEETLDDVLPKKVVEQYNQFAEVKTFAQGDKPIFKRKLGSNKRAKQFITRVGLAGIYEVFKLSKLEESFEVRTSAIGGAAQIGFEEWLDGRVDFADVLDILYEGIDECIYSEIEKQLIGAVSNVQAANKVTHNAFSEVAMDRLLQISDSYGAKSDIYCTFEFAATMVPSSGWVSDDMKNEKWNNGYLGNYKGHKVIVLNQSYEDETNTTKVIDPRYAWIIPSGATKPVKIAFEGGAIVDEYQNYDRSKEIQIYKKVGVRAIFSNDICVYENTSLSRDTGSGV